MKDVPIMELTLRKYEPPSGEFDQDLRMFLLSMGLVRPGDERSPAETIFKTLLTSNNPVSVSKMAEKAGITESAVRYHLERLKSMRLVEGRREYRLAEGDLLVSFRVFRRYVVEEVLDRIEAYVSQLAGR